MSQTGVMVTGFIHPGSMGASLAAACSGDTSWASTGRSPASIERASEAGIRDVVTLDALVDCCDVIVSICPPDAAEKVAESIARRGFKGTYVDANAIAPATTRSISSRFEHFVDGAVIGPPVHKRGSTRLYLSGEGAEDVAALWNKSDLDALVIDGGPGAASALKMAYAGWTKASAALLFTVVALAEAEGVGDDLLAEWAISQPDLAHRAEQGAAGAAPKAWRWVGEMEEIAASLQSVELPTGFHQGAAEVYARLASFKDNAGGPSLDELTDTLLNGRST